MGAEFLLVLNKGENTVQYINTANGEIDLTIPVDQNPHEVVVTDDGRCSYVTNSGGGTVSVLDNGICLAMADRSLQTVSALLPCL